MRKSSLLVRWLMALVAVSGVFLFGAAKKEIKPPGIAVPESILDGLKFRCIGPAIMGGRIDDFAVVESNPHIFYAGIASGGVWKTVNNGVTWEPIFDNETTSSVGDVTVSQSNPDIVWVGTGEPNNRQSSSWGDGVYKSTDGGKTWKNMGLRETQSIGRMAIHPTNPDIVYVAAVGRLWGANKERGVFKTTDGGKTWKNVNFINEDTGFVDIVMDPENPDTLYAAAYQRRRTAYGFVGGGPHSGLFKTTDGGETWVKLTNGLPQGNIGRIGIDIFRKNPNIVYGIYEHRDGGVFRSEDKGLSWTKMSSTNNRPMYYSKIRIDPQNDQRIWAAGAAMYFSDDGGKNFRTDLVQRIHGDYHAMWINPADSNHMIFGSDGGIHISYDRGLAWDFINTIPLGQFYEIGYDMRKPFYYVYGGLQDNGSWGAPVATWNRQGVSNDEWFRIGGGDGFYVQVDPDDHNTIYAESQDGNVFRLDLYTGQTKPIRPEPPDSKETYRFNWNSPILISPHNSKMIYYGGNKLFISKDRGDTWEATEDLTTKTDRNKLPIMGAVPEAGALSRHDGVLHYGTITTVTESPLKARLLYVGTDDGYLQVSRDGGQTWKNVAGKVAGLPKNTYVSRVVASRFVEGRVYATFDGHRSDDFNAYIFVSEDYGETWKNISGNIPLGSTLSVIRESLQNPNVLFVGTERGAYFSIDRGERWVMLKSNVPMVPVDDIAIHPRENDLILGTHGRSIWVLDGAAAFDELTPETLQSASYLFSMRPAMMFTPYSHKGDTGHKVYIAPNPPPGAMITYYLKESSKEEPEVVVADGTGEVVRKLKGTKDAGINRIIWDLRHEPIQAETSQPVGPGRGFGQTAPFVFPGEYKVTLKAAGRETAKAVLVEPDPRIEVAFEVRKAQHDALMTLYKLSPLMSQAERTLDVLRKQLDDLNADLKKLAEVPAPVNEAVKAAAAELGKIRTELAGDMSAGFEGMRASLRGRIMMLSRAISGILAAPTDRQQQDLQKCSETLKSLIDRINAYIDVEIPRLNKLLNENNIPHLLPVAKIKM